MPTLVMYRVVALLAVTAFAVTACTDASSTGDGSTGAKYELISVDAGDLRQAISEIDADIRIINVWATWCGPCHVEMPEFVRLAEDLVDENVAVRFLSVDDLDKVPAVEQFVQQYGISGPTYVSSVGNEVILAIHPRWQYGLPTTLMIDRQMRIRDFWEGAVTYDFLLAKVERMRGILAEEANLGNETAGQDRS